MRWPRKQSFPRDQLVFAWSGNALAYVQASLRDDGLYQVQRMGVERQGTDSAEDFAKRLGALGLKGRSARVMLRPEQYQVLQIEAPAVAPEELRAAARWQIREMVDLHMDDLTLDVMRVGDAQVRTTAHLFVVAASNAVIRDVMDIGSNLRCPVDVIDIQDVAQRNLQSALARRDGSLERARAAIVLVDDRHALLTISANEELFYTRRIELGAGFLNGAWGQSTYAADNGSVVPVPEYVPGRGGLAAPELSMAAGDSDRTQRLVVEIQRSLDLWDRSWPTLPLNGVSVFAGVRTDEFAQWLGSELGQSVSTMDVGSLFPGFEAGSSADQMLCWPLLGALMRTENRKL